MINTIPVSKLDKYKNADEKYIYGVDGDLRQLFFYDALYSFVPYAFFHYVPYTIYEMCIKCIFAVTDKRILVFEIDSEGSISDKYIHSFSFNQVNVEFKKVLGKRVFTLEKRRKRYFRPEDNFLTIEIDSSNISQAENIYALISEHYMKKQGN